MTQHKCNCSANGDKKHQNSLSAGKSLSNRLSKTVQQPFVVTQGRLWGITAWWIHCTAAGWNLDLLKEPIANADWGAEAALHSRDRLHSPERSCNIYLLNTILLLSINPALDQWIELHPVYQAAAPPISCHPFFSSELKLPSQNLDLKQYLTGWTLQECNRAMQKASALQNTEKNLQLSKKMVHKKGDISRCLL